MRLRPYLKLARADHAAVASIATLIGLAAACGGWAALPPAQALLGVVVTVAAEVALFVFNDVFNLEEDRVNAPDRPLVSGEVKLSHARLMGVTSMAVAVLSASVLGVAALLIVILALSSGMAYNVKLKREGLPGNIVVALDTALPFVFGSAILVGFNAPFKVVVFFLIAFTAALGREVLKGIRDVEGDRRAGVKTLAVTRGVKAAAYVSAALNVAAIAMSPLPLFSATSPLGWAAYLVLIVATDSLFLYSVALIASKVDRETADKARRYTLLGMLCGTLAFAAAA